MKMIALCVIAGLLLAGCSSPYIAPDTSKALTEQSQYEESKAQTEAMKEQNKQLKRIADALEKK